MQKSVHLTQYLNICKRMSILYSISSRRVSYHTKYLVCMQKSVHLPQYLNICKSVHLIQYLVCTQNSVHLTKHLVSIQKKKCPSYTISHYTFSLRNVITVHLYLHIIIINPNSLSLPKTFTSESKHFAYIYIYIYIYILTYISESRGPIMATSRAQK